jgi:3'(2'), 5'-bisphosphate nucleotidase
VGEEEEAGILTGAKDSDSLLPLNESSGAGLNFNCSFSLSFIQLNLTDYFLMLKQLLPQVIDIAKEAGSAIMRIYAQSGNEVAYKADNSPLTEADLASDRLIIEGLTRITPNLPILTEESVHSLFESRSSWTRFWLVDPLDGTKEFIRRNGEFTVNIALIENSRPILGVVYAPALGVCYFAANGAGAYVERNKAPAQRIFVKNRADYETIRVVASRSHSGARTEALLNRLGRYESVSMGSSLKFCLVAEGAAHFYPRLGPTMEWDTAAAHAVVNEAGGRVCDLSGIELKYNKPDLHNPEFYVLAKNDRLLQALIKACG